MKAEALNGQVSALDHATFMGPISIRTTDGRGHGLFTTAPVKVGDLLLYKKAFAYLCGSTKNIPDEGVLVSMNVPKLCQNLSLATNIDHLDCKTASPVIKKRPDESVSVDS